MNANIMQMPKSLANIMQMPKALANIMQMPLVPCTVDIASIAPAFHIVILCYVVPNYYSTLFFTK